ncbi:uncharacterized protein LOC113558954 [Rhopalosiphum maidis]|uniref:uncharacterized protein LOC113558954 n=1 Tax=Rhopalosiphum maidis TaxID=43146 RepID=UPI000F005E34|nr:uncharacterized protein LOC113558954 [Rhopalosiphum maidis]
MPEDRIRFPLEDAEELQNPTNDEVDEQLRQSEELTLWEINMGLGRNNDNDDETDTWSEEGNNDEISMDSSEEESGEQANSLFFPSPTVRRHPEVMSFRGINVARRGRPRGHSSNPNSTPFQRGITFNGFVRNLELEKVVGYSLDRTGALLYKVKWRNDGDRIRLIESSLMRTYKPLMVVDFFESMVMNPQD